MTTFHPTFLTAMNQRNGIQAGLWLIGGMDMLNSNAYSVENRELRWWEGP